MSFKSCFAKHAFPFYHVRLCSYTRKCLSYLLNKITTIVFEAQKIKQIPLNQIAAMIGSGILVKMRLGGTWLYPTGVTLRDSTGGWSVNTGVSVGTGGNCPYTMDSVIALHTSKK